MPDSDEVALFKSAASAGWKIPPNQMFFFEKHSIFYKHKIFYVNGSKKEQVTEQAIGRSPGYSFGVKISRLHIMVQFYILS